MYIHFENTYRKTVYNSLFFGIASTQHMNVFLISWLYPFVLLIPFVSHIYGGLYGTARASSKLLPTKNTTSNTKIFNKLTLRFQIEWRIITRKQNKFKQKRMVCYWKYLYTMVNHLFVVRRTTNRMDLIDFVWGWWKMNFIHSFWLNLRLDPSITLLYRYFVFRFHSFQLFSLYLSLL